MTFQRRLALVFSAAALIPIVVFGVGVRREMGAELKLQASAREAAVVRLIHAALGSEMVSTRARLAGLVADLSGDNRLRLAALAGGDRTWLLDWAGSAMRTSGFAALVLQDSTGRILSSGQFRNDYDRLSPQSARAALSSLEVIGRFRTADGSFLARVAADTFSVAGRPFVLLGGPLIDSAGVAALAPGTEIAAVLAVDDTVPPGATVAETPFLMFDDATGAVGPVRIFVTADPAPRRALTAQVDRWFLGAIGLTLGVAVASAVWLAGIVSRPLAELARKTERLDLERLDQQFASDRDDEIGALAGLLDAMTRRLRAGAQRLRESERRATVGDLARQVNHDVKNGLAPIRHVVRHLGQVAESQPDQLAAVYQERRDTLESSIDYLDQLARNYAKLSPSQELGAGNVNLLLDELAMTIDAERVTLVTRLDPGTPPIRGDRVVLRRIFENLLINAVEAVDGEGTVTLSTEALPDGRGVRATVADSGRGMAQDELERAFDDFFTTKVQGTGLGLSVVRRLVADLGGSIRAETAPGQGTVMIVELPQA